MTSYWQLALQDIHAGKLIKDIKEHIQRSTLIYMQQFGRTNWIPASTLSEALGKYENFDFSNPKVQKFFFLLGAQSKVRTSTSELRKLGYPIIAGIGKKGYKYADWNCPDIIEAWNDRHSLFEKRKRDIDNEEKIDCIILDKLIKEAPEQTKKEQLIVVRNKYKNKGEEK